MRELLEAFRDYYSPCTAGTRRVAFNSPTLGFIKNKGGLVEVDVGESGSRYRIALWFIPYGLKFYMDKPGQWDLENCRVFQDLNEKGELERIWNDGFKWNLADDELQLKGRAIERTYFAVQGMLAVGDEPENTHEDYCNELCRILGENLSRLWLTYPSQVRYFPKPSDEPIF